MSLDIKTCGLIGLIILAFVWHPAQSTYGQAVNVTEILQRRKVARQPSGTMNLPVISSACRTLHLILGGDTYGVGYVDPISKTIFRWRDINLKWKQLPGHDWKLRQSPG